MNPRISPYFALPLVFLCGCPQVWPDFVTCEEQNACGTTEPGSTEPASTDGETSTTSESSCDVSVASRMDGGMPNSVGSKGVLERNAPRFAYVMSGAF